MKKSMLVVGVSVAALVLGIATVAAQTGGAGAGAENHQTGITGNAGGAVHPGAAETTAPSVRGGMTSGGHNELKENSKGAAEMKPNANGGAKTGAERQSNAEKGKGSATPAARTEVDQHNVGGGAEGARKDAKEGNGEAVSKEQAGLNKMSETHRSSVSNISSGERTRVRSEISNVNIKEASNINVSPEVGAVAPRTITEYWMPVPQEIVTIVPAWRSYRIVKVGGEILIIDPNSFTIVDVFPG